MSTSDNNKRQIDLKKKALSVGAVMLAAGLMVGDVSAADTQKKPGAAASKQDTDTDQAAIELELADVLEMFANNDGMVSLDLIAHLLDLTEEEEDLFAAYMKAGDMLPVDDALTVIDGLEERSITMGMISEEIDASPSLKKAGTLLKGFLTENVGRVPSAGLIAEIA
jgi:hypothetical protein